MIQQEQTRLSPYIYAGVVDRTMTPDDFIKLSCKALGITTDILKLRSRKSDLVFIRAAISKRMLEVYKNITLMEVGRFINRDHATVLYYRDRMPSSPEFENNYRKLLTLV